MWKQIAGSWIPHVFFSLGSPVPSRKWFATDVRSTSGCRNRYSILLISIDMIWCWHVLIWLISMSFKDSSNTKQQCRLLTAIPWRNITKLRLRLRWLGLCQSLKFHLDLARNFNPLCDRKFQDIAPRRSACWTQAALQQNSRMYDDELVI